MSTVFPPAFEDRMKAQLGSAFESFRQSHESSSPVSIRFNPAKAEPPDTQRIPWTKFGRYLNERPIFTLDPLLHGGTYYVQEASSMFLEQAITQSVDLKRELKVLDLCAAPGGKSTHLLSLISSDSLLISNEVIRSRATILLENIQKWGYPNVVVTNNDPHDFQAMKGYFDLMVIDAPCSGEGLFRKDPDAMNEWSPENATLCAQRQRRILANVWPALKKDGVLIYCTCTYNPEENEKALQWINESGFGESIELNIDPAWGIERSSIGNITGYHFYPHKTTGEGFFLTALKKTEESETTRIRSKHLFHRLPIKTADRLQSWIHDASKFDLILQESLILMMPARHKDDIEFISKELHLIAKGSAVAELKHEKLIPEHAVALSTALNKENFMIVEADLPTALAYLRKDNIVLDDTRKGFALMMYNNIGIGWVNLLGNRVNNLYPNNWRIRMGK